MPKPLSGNHPSLTLGRSAPRTCAWRKIRPRLPALQAAATWTVYVPGHSPHTGSLVAIAPHLQPADHLLKFKHVRATALRADQQHANARVLAVVGERNALVF